MRRKSPPPPSSSGSERVPRRKKTSAKQEQSSASNELPVLRGRSLRKRITEEEACEALDVLTQSIQKKDVENILNREKKILSMARSGPLAQWLQDIKDLFSMIRDFVNGSYKEVPINTVGGAAAALLYVWMPLDLIPDFIPGIGLMDDVAVLLFLRKRILSDLNGYLRWKERKKKQQEKMEMA